MQTLGYDRYNIYGLSYGTRLALEAMRDDSEHVRSVVLDSTEPPQSRGQAEQAASFDRVITVLVAGCKADAGCAKAYPTLEQTFFDLVARADGSPIQVEPRDPATGMPARVVVNGDRILAGAFRRQTAGVRRSRPSAWLRRKVRHDWDGGRRRTARR